MKRNLRNLADKQFDLLVVGGGIFGACAAWDAALRGLKVALLEKGDFSGETSAHHMKLVHGGIRYLQHGDLIRVWESSRERSAMLKIAPHLVQPLPIIMPTYGHGMKGKFVLGTGVTLYDMLTMNRNRDLPDEGRQIPNGRLMSREEVFEQFPGVKKEGLTGAAVFYDTQMYNPPRLVLSFIRSAADAGAETANYVEATGFLRKGDRIEGVRARCVRSGEQFDVRARVVLNAAGPWAEKVLEDGMGLRLEKRPVFSRDVCFVVPRLPKGKYALACQIGTEDAEALVSRGGRHLFLAPWRDCTLVGVWHGVFDGRPEDVTVSRAEMKKFLDEANEAYPTLGLAPDDVSVVNTGLILFAENREETEKISFGHRSILLDHEAKHNLGGLITLIGVRATTARGMGEKAVDLVFRKLGKTPSRSKTETTPIFGGRIEHFDGFLEQLRRQRPHGLEDGVLEQLVHNYGSEHQAVLKYVEKRPELGARLGDTMVIGAEVVHAVREEMAERLGDVVYRRTDLGTGRSPGSAALSECARIMAKEAGWDEERTKEETEEVRRYFVRHGATAEGRTAVNAG